MYRVTRIGWMALLLWVVPTVGWAQEASSGIAFLDSQRIIQEAPGYQEANDAFNRTAAGWQDTLEQKRTTLQQMFDDYKKQEVILSPEMKTERQQEMLRLEQEAQTYFEQKFGPEGEANLRQAELLQPIIERVNQVIEEARRELGYAVVFDLNDGAVIAGDPAHNITDEVVRRLKAQPVTDSSR